jgi:hypothetical protein
MFLAPINIGGCGAMNDSIWLELFENSLDLRFPGQVDWQQPGSGKTHRMLMIEPNHFAPLLLRQRDQTGPKQPTRSRDENHRGTAEVNMQFFPSSTA